MKLTIDERFTMLQILPRETNFLILKIVRDLEEQLSLNEKEIKDWKVTSKVSANGESVNFAWDTSKAEEKEIEIGEKATDVIVEALSKMDKANKLTKEHFTLYEKFIEN